MKYKHLPGGEKIPALGFGTWNIGGRMTPNPAEDEKSLRAIRTALELGYTHIDTAEMYAGGHTEKLVSQAIEQAGADRSRLFITSKVWHTNLRGKDVIRACEASLDRLDTAYIDLYLIHWPNTAVPLEETFRALNALAAEGKVRYVGVSNFDRSQLEKAIQLCDTTIATNQVPYSLHNRSCVENGVLAACQENDILLTAYTPVEKGKVMEDPVLQSIAAELGVTPIQVALAWLTMQDQVITIPMSMNPAHIAENLAAADLELPPEAVSRLNEI
jgi:diketogulonate reductase-like aldo/keto reductase